MHPVGCASLRAVIFVAFLLVGQFFALSHSVGHDLGRSDCVVCRISEPHKQAVVSFATADAAAATESIEAVFSPIPDSLKYTTYGTQRKRAPPFPS